MRLIERKDCPMRHENGNCTVAGGFCTAVNDPICEALHNAYDCGRRSIDPESLRPKGEWIDGQCSNCGYQAKIREIVPHWDGGFITIYENDNFCPNCGADMRGEKSER